MPYGICRFLIQNVKHLDPDQDRHFVGPDLDPNCLQRLSESVKIVSNKRRDNLSLLNLLTSRCFKKKIVVCDQLMLSHTYSATESS